jgi:pimeloyl-ACP methyl ester carboxylesterase
MHRCAVLEGVAVDGLPIVFVHGIRVNGAAWSAQLEQVGARYPVHALDLPGHGTRRGERFTVDSAIDAVAEAVDDFGGRALVVGHSLGGYVSIAAAARHPARIAGLVLAGCSFVPGRVLTTPFRLAHRMLSGLPDGGDGISRRVLSKMLPAQVANAVASGGIATEVIPDVVALAPRLDVVAALAGYPGPVWLINGGHDHFRLHERRFLAACTDGRLLIVPGAGHYLPMTHPDELSRLVLDAAAAAESPGRTGISGTTSSE